MAVDKPRPPVAIDRQVEGRYPFFDPIVRDDHVVITAAATEPNRETIPCYYSEIRFGLSLDCGCILKDRLPDYQNLQSRSGKVLVVLEDVVDIDHVLQCDVAPVKLRNRPLYE